MLEIDIRPRQQRERSDIGGLNVIVVEPSGVQVLKNPNPLKDVEASALLDVDVLV